MSFKTEWDLQKYFYTSISDPQIDKDIESGVLELKNHLSKYKTKKISELSDEDFLVYLQEADSSSLLMKVAFYLSYLNTLDTQNQEVIKKQSSLDTICSEISIEGLFLDEENIKIGSEGFIRRAELPMFAAYKNSLLNQAEKIKYYLHESAEKAVITLGQGGASVIESIYSELTNSFEFEIEMDGEKQMVTDSEIRSLRMHEDPEIRKKAYNSMHKVYGSKQNRIVLGNVYKGVVKECIADKKLRNIPSVMHSRNSGEELSDEVVNQLIKTVREAYHLYHRFVKLKAKKLGTEKLSNYDLFAPTTDSVKTFRFEEGLEKYLNIIKDFDKEFYDYSKEMFENGRVDVFPNKGKQGGAYANYFKNFESFIVLNYTDSFNDVTTLAHELGHAIHGHLSQGQVASCFSSPLSLAETASIFNETLVFDKMMEESDFTEDEEIHYRFEQLSDIFSTTFRQIQYVIFEKRIHESFDNGIELSHEDFSLIWRETQKEMMGDGFEFSIPAEEEFAWSSIPHIFYTPFYCYAYSFGNLLSLSLYKMYKDQGQPFVEQYKNILRSGGSKRPEDLLLENGIDIKDEAFFKSGIDMIEELMVKLESKIK